MSKKRPDRERMKERLRSTQELSGGPFRLSAINRHHQFAMLHEAARSRVRGTLDMARGALDLSRAARTDQWVNRLSPMALIERRFTMDRAKDG